MKITRSRWALCVRTAAHYVGSYNVTERYTTHKIYVCFRLSRAPLRTHLFNHHFAIVLKMRNDWSVFFSTTPLLPRAIPFSFTHGRRNRTFDYGSMLVAAPTKPTDHLPFNKKWKFLQMRCVTRKLKANTADVFFSGLVRDSREFRIHT